MCLENRHVGFDQCLNGVNAFAKVVNPPRMTHESVEHSETSQNISTLPEYRSSQPDGDYRPILFSQGNASKLIEVILIYLLFKCPNFLVQKK